MTARKRTTKSKESDGERIVGRIGGDLPRGDCDPYADDMETPYLTMEEAARYLKIGSHVTLRKLIRTEGLPVVELGPRMLRTKRQWLDEWMKRRAEEQHGA